MNGFKNLTPEKIKKILNIFWENEQKKILIIIVAIAGIISVYFLLKLLIKRVIIFSIGIKETLSKKSIPIERVKTLNSVFNSILKLFSFLAICLIFLNIFEIKLLPIIAGAGFLGAAIIVMFQDVFKDIFKGWIMIFDDQYRKGEWILINNNFQGEVNHLSLRSTTLKDKDGSLHIIPNSQIIFVSNISRNPKMFSLKLVIDNKKDFSELKQELELTLKQFTTAQSTDMKPLGFKISGIEKIFAEDYLIEIKFKAYYPIGEMILEGLRNFIFEKNKELNFGIKREE